MAEVVTPASLRSRLHRLARERDRAIVRREEVEADIGELLLDVQLTDGITMTDAAQVLGISKPTAYRLLEST